VFLMLRTERGIVLEGRGRSGSRGVSNAKNRKRDSSGFSALLLPENKERVSREVGVSLIRTRPSVQISDKE